MVLTEGSAYDHRVLLRAGWSVAAVSGLRELPNSGHARRSGATATGVRRVVAAVPLSGPLAPGDPCAILDVMQEFDAVLEAAEAGPGCGLRLPFDAKAVLGGARAPVVVTVNGQPPFRTTTAAYGGVSWIGLRRDQQAQFQVGVGDQVQVTVAPDDEPRAVALPPELAQALTYAPEAVSAYEVLSHTHRKEYARWVSDAKRAETRAARAAKAVTMLQHGVRTPD